MRSTASGLCATAAVPGPPPCLGLPSSPRQRTRRGDKATQAERRPLRSEECWGHCGLGPSPVRPGGRPEAGATAQVWGHSATGPGRGLHGLTALRLLSRLWAFLPVLQILSRGLRDLRGSLTRSTMAQAARFTDGSARAARFRGLPGLPCRECLPLLPQGSIPGVTGRRLCHRPGSEVVAPLRSER